MHYYGIDHQLAKTQEECAELIDAIAKFLQGRVDEDAVVTEIADVQIMLEQLKIVFGKDAVRLEINRKIERLEQRIKNETK